MKKMKLVIRRNGTAYMAPKSYLKPLVISLGLTCLLAYSITNSSGSTDNRELTITQKVMDQVPLIKVDTTDIMVQWVMKYNVPRELAEDIVNHSIYQGAQQGVDPKLILALIKVESTFKPTAISKSNALGLMQVILVWHKEKLHDYRVFDTAVNIELGTRVLSEYSKGNSIRTALLKYNGALGKPNDYPDKIITAKNELDSFIKGKIYE